MNGFAKSLRLIAIVDRRALARPVEATVSALLAGGVTAILLREKGRPEREVAEGLPELASIVQDSGGLMLVSHHVGTAIAASADGVVLNRDSIGANKAQGLAAEADLRKFLVGYSAHRGESAVSLAAGGLPDFCLVAPVFPPLSKPLAGEALGPEGLQELVRQLTPVPCIALGGITGQNITLCRGSGIEGVASITWLVGDPDPQARARELRAGLRKIGLD